MSHNKKFESRERFYYRRIREWAANAEGTVSRPELAAAIGAPKSSTAFILATDNAIHDDILREWQEDPFSRVRLRPF